jgi:ribonucleoside-triphosphate reductase
VGYAHDIFDLLDHQDQLQAKFTGGTVVHCFIGEKIDDPEMVKILVKSIAYNYHIPYFTITPTFSICPVHGYIPGNHTYCPYPHTKEELEMFGIEVEIEDRELSKPIETTHRIVS